MNELPASWVKTALGQVVSYADNETVDPADMPPEAWLLELEDIERDTGKVLERKTVGERAPKSSKNRFQAGDVLYGKLRPYLNKVVRADQDGFCSGEIIAISPGLLDKNYLFYSMRSPSFIEYVSSVSHGMRMPRLGTQQAKSAPFVLPPRAEQTRIAAKLDELLAQVDTLKARTDGIPALLKRFRQSVLAAAVSGRLTEEWRFALGAETNWVKASFTEFFDIQGGTQPPKSAFVAEPQPGYVQLVQIRDFGDKPVPTFVPDSKSLKKFDCDDFLIGRYGASVGRICTGLSGAYNVALVKVLVLHPASVYKPFLGVLLRSPRFQSSITGFERSAQDGFNKGDLSTIEVALPPLLEQTEIVRRVEQLFAFADQLEARVKAAQVRIDRLTQSILAKAFRGELVPQDPNDEPASVLLERIKAQRAAVPKARRGRRAATLG